MVVQFAADFIRSQKHLNKLAFVNHSAELTILPHFEINPGHNYKFQVKLYLERDVYNFSYFSFKGCTKNFNIKSLSAIDESVIKKSGQCGHVCRNSSFDLQLKKGPVLLDFDLQIDTPYLDIPIVMQTIFLKSTRNWIEIVCNHDLTTNLEKIAWEMKTEQLVTELEKEKKAYEV